MVRETRPRSWTVVGALVVAGWGANQFTPLSVVYRTEEGWGNLTVVAMFTVYLAGLVPGLLLGCPAADRWGRRPVVRTALLVLAAASVVLAGVAFTPATVYLSRLATGIAAGLIISAGSVWVQELSEAAARRRAIYAVGAGFAAGPLLSGLLAQWLPAPEVVPCLVHAVVTLVLLSLTARAVETNGAAAEDRRRRAEDRWSAVTHPRFIGVVLPASPAIFAAVTVAYVVLPPLVHDQVKSYAPLFSGLVAAVTITVGLIVQPLAKRIDHPGSARAILIAMSTVVVGLLIGSVAVEALSPALVLVAAAVLGAGYGLTLEAGLAELDRLTTPSTLPIASALFQGVAHSGFLAPLVLALSSGTATYPHLLTAMSALGLVALTVAATYSRGHHPVAERSTAWDE